MELVSGELEVRTRSQFEVIDVTGEVNKWLREICAQEGLVVMFLPHTTAAITINEAEPGLRQDIVDIIKELFRPGWGWRHNTVDDNAHAHLASVIIGNSRVAPVSGGSLSMGTWQSIMFIEMDGPRRRTLKLFFIGDKAGECEGAKEREAS